jgi:hypothetical protein
MKHPQAHQEWDRLFETTARIKKLTPWKWMNESDVFGVQHPATGEIGFVSVMGALGEHTAVSVYLGAPALAKFMYLQQVPAAVFEEYPEMLLEIPQLQASFEDREILDEWDRQLIRNMGLKFHGRKAWPRFQSFRAGFMPWRLEAEEVRFLTLSLEQLEEVSPRVRADRSLLPNHPAGGFLIRACCIPDGKPGEWEDRYQQIPPPEFPPVPLTWDPNDLKRLKRTTSRGNIIELDFFQFPGAIGKEGQRPAAAYVLLAVHAQSNMILCAEFVQVRDTLENMWGQIPGIILSRLADMKMRPKEIRVQSHLLLNVLPPAFDSLGTKVVFKPSLKILRAAKREMLAFFEKGKMPWES